MRITDLEITDFKTLEHFQWGPIPDTGVFVVHGDNEQGKSTILEAVHQVLFIKHGSRAGTVRASQPLGRDVGPQVRINLDFGGINCQLTKQWLRGAKAELTIAGEGSYTGARAEDRFTELFQEHIDTNLFEVLFNRQGELSTTIGAGGIAPLQQALGEQSASSDDLIQLAGESGELLARVTEEYEKYYSLKTGRPGKALKQAESRLGQASERQAEAAAKLAALEEHIAQVERIQQASAQAESELPAAITTKQELDAELETAKQIAEEVTRLGHETRLAQQQLTMKQAELNQREELNQRIAQATARVATLTAEVAKSQAAAEAEREQLSQLATRLEQALITERSCSHQLQQAKSVMEAVLTATRRAELEKTLSVVVDLDTKIRALGNPKEVSEATIEALELVEQEVLLARHTLNLKAAKLEISATTPTDVSIDGQVLELREPVEREIATPTTLVVGAVTATISPGAGTKESAQLLHEAERKQQEAVAEFGFPNATAARRGREEYLSAQQQLKHLRLQRAEMLKDRNLEDIQAELSEEFEPVNQDLESARQQLHAVEQALAQAQSEREAASAENNQMQERQAERDYIAKAAVLKEAEIALTEVQQQLQQAEADITTEQLQVALDQAATALAVARAKEEASQSELQAIDMESKQQLAAAATARLTHLEQTIATAEKDIAAQQSYIDAYAGAAGELDLAEAELTVARRHEEALTRRAKAAKLLYEVMVAKQQEAHTRYSGPLIAELVRLSKPVFGAGVNYLLSDSLEVTQRVGERGEVVDVSALSGGAQEQLAILIRFAVASLAAGAQGEAAPVFFDDALGSTDPGRLLAMGAVFSEMGKSRQVFVFTCVPNRYGAVIGRIDTPIRELLQKSHSARMRS